MGLQHRDRERYHQLHPAKLLTDWGTAILAGVLLWKQRWLTALAISFIPSIGVTALFLSGHLDDALERIRRRPMVRASARHLSADVNALRFAGLAVSWTGCWSHHAWMIPAGVMVIAGG